MITNKLQIDILKEYFYQLINFKQVKLPSNKYISYELLDKEKLTEKDIELLELLHNTLEVS